MLISIVHIAKISPTPSVVYIGRRSPARGLAASPLANPYRIGQHGNREEVIEKYRRWLFREVKARGSAYRELCALLARARDGEELQLACWCAPQACHGEVVRRALLWLDKELP